LNRKLELIVHIPTELIDVLICSFCSRVPTTQPGRLVTIGTVRYICCTFSPRVFRSRGLGPKPFSQNKTFNNRIALYTRILCPAPVCHCTLDLCTVPCDIWSVRRNKNVRGDYRVHERHKSRAERTQRSQDPYRGCRKQKRVTGRPELFVEHGETFAADGRGRQASSQSERHWTDNDGPIGNNSGVKKRAELLCRRGTATVAVDDHFSSIIRYPKIN